MGCSCSPVHRAEKWRLSRRWPPDGRFFKCSQQLSLSGSLPPGFTRPSLPRDSPSEAEGVPTPWATLPFRPVQAASACALFPRAGRFRMQAPFCMRAVLTHRPLPYPPFLSPLSPRSLRHALLLRILSPFAPDHRHGRHHCRGGAVGRLHGRLPGGGAAHRADSGFGARTGSAGAGGTTGHRAGLLDSQRADERGALAAAGRPAAGMAERRQSARCHRHHARYRHAGGDGVLPVAGAAAHAAGAADGGDATGQRAQCRWAGQSVRCLPLCAGGATGRHRWGVRELWRPGAACGCGVQAACQPDGCVCAALRSAGGLAGSGPAVLAAAFAGRDGAAGAVCRAADDADGSDTSVSHADSRFWHAGARWNAAGGNRLTVG